MISREILVEPSLEYLRSKIHIVSAKLGRWLCSDGNKVSSALQT